MASKTSAEKCSATVKQGKAQETLKKLQNKLLSDLERDFLRLFQDSLYCDIKLTVNTSSVLTHSCILKARALKFYKFIYNEFEVLKQNGICVFNFYNASFAYLQAFVENIYTNIHSSKAEDHIIEHLQETKYHSFEGGKVEKKNIVSLNPVSPDSDLFFTPKCSPSEIQKPFALSSGKGNENNVVSYYKIVSVDDIPVEEKLGNNKNEENCTQKEEEELFERELAEQDELFTSFQTIVKKSKSKTYSVSVSSQSTKKTKPKVYKKFDSNVLVHGDHQNNKRNQVPLWKPNPACESTIRKDIKTSKTSKNFTKRSSKPQEVITESRTSLDITTSLCSSDMDISTTGGDSGLENSSICQPEISPKENTTSETSGVDLTESTVNDDIPNDETLSAKQPGSTGSSLSSEVGTWDANEDYKTKSNSIHVESPTFSERCTNPSQGHFDDNDFNGRNNLNDEEISRLDEMERNIRDCEIFLLMERKGSYVSQPTDSKGDSNYYKTEQVPKDFEDDFEISKNSENYRYAEEEIGVNNPEESLHEDSDHLLNNDDCNRYSTERNLGDANMYYGNENGTECLNCNFEVGESSNTREAIETRRNLDLDYLASSDKDYEFSSKHFEAEETKTPPCTPKKIKLDTAHTKPDNEKDSEDLVQVKSSYSENGNPSNVANYFIDASSLLDDDEIVTPPISLLNFKSIQSYDNNEDKVAIEEEPKVEKTVISNFYHDDAESVRNDEEEISHLQEEERRQGDMLFSTSIPHFSKHDFQGNLLMDSNERLGSSNNYTEVSEDESEQVVPSADTPIESTSRNTLSPKRRDNIEPKIPVFEQPRASGEYESEFSETEDRPDGDIRETQSESLSNVSGENSFRGSYSTSVASGSPNFGRKKESMPVLSSRSDFPSEKKVERTPSYTQAEAWVVTFDDKKAKNKMLVSSESGLGMESGRESADERNTPPMYKSCHEPRQIRKKELPIEFLVDVNDRKNGSSKEDIKPTQNQAYPVEKSNSFGYFLDFGKESDNESIQKEEEKADSKNEKKNMFSMFIGMEDEGNITKKTRPVLEKERTFDKGCDYSQNESLSNNSDATESLEETRKPFYMFIESDSPSVKRKQIPKRSMRPLFEPVSVDTRRSYLRSQSYDKDRLNEMASPQKPEAKTDAECSSSDNSLSLVENDSKTSRVSKGKLPLPLNKHRGFSNPSSETKMTAWSETKVKNDTSVSSESWLKTNDVQINYTGKASNQSKELYLKKDSTFVKEEYEAKNFKGSLDLKEDPKKGKSSEGHSDSGIKEKEESSSTFVKLSDMDCSVDFRVKKPNERMSQSITESSTRKPGAETTLSRSIGSETRKSGSNISSIYDKQVNRSLTRLFPNVSPHLLASISRKDGDVQTSGHSEAYSSLQSSADPSGLDISTSETDISSHLGGSSRLGEDLLKMFLEEIGSDVIVEVAGRRIKAHKCILSSRCQYFAAALSGGWVESAGNVISLQGFSYNTVHFALRYIYSGESRIPESLNILELATLADMLCLVGLQEVISYYLKVKFCHSFHVPCSVCSIGVLDCLPIAAAYGLDDLYRKCLKWITKYFVRLWPTKSFGTLPKELLDKCYQHYLVHMTVDNVLDTVVNIDKIRGFLPNVRWAEPVSRLVKKLNSATIRYIAQHFSSVLTSDNFLALGKEDGWSVSLLEDSLIEAIKYLPPEQACWSHARLHRILSVAGGPDSPPEMDWNDRFIKLLQNIAEIVEYNLIKQAPRAAKSKAWRQMEPELRSRIQESACLVLSDEDTSPVYRRSHQTKREHQPVIPQTAKSRNLEIRQIKLAMSQQANRIPSSSRPLSLQIDQRPKKDSRFVPLRQSASTSSVRKPEPVQTIRKSYSRSQILGSTTSEPKKTINPRYSEVKSRYLEPKSPQKTRGPDKYTSNTNQNQRRKYISSSDSSRNRSPALRPSSSKTSVPQNKKTPGSNRPSRDTVVKSDSATTINSRSYRSTRSDNFSTKMVSRLAAEENMSSDSLCTDSLLSDKDATSRRKQSDMESNFRGKENLDAKRRPDSSLPKPQSSTNSPTTKRLNSKNQSTTGAKVVPTHKFIIPRPPTDSKTTNSTKRYTTGKIPIANTHLGKAHVTSSSTNRNQRNSGKPDVNLMNGNSNRKRNEVDSENNKNISKENICNPSALSRSGTFLKDEPTILKKPQVESANGIV